jgi:hypothetical protein
MSPELPTPEEQKAIDRMIDADIEFQEEEWHEQERLAILRQDL